jgi:Ni/Co efflux regulator RcnB
MRNRLTKTILAAATIAAVALPAGAQAKQGADDPAGHVRHASHQTATSAHQSRHRHHHANRGVRRHGADDNRGVRRHGADDNRGVRRGGADDGPNHR